VPQEWTTVRDRLDIHGVRYRRFTHAWSDTVEVQRIVEWSEAPTTFEGHHNLSVTQVSLERRLRSYRAGDLWIPCDQARALVAMVDRFFPDRTASLRQSTVQEIKATSVIAMEIEEASAKIRAKGVGDDEEDYELPIYAERIPVRTVLGAPEPCPRLLDGVERPASLRGYSEGRLLEDALRDAHFAHYAGG
jgi:hypothetical protein